MSKTISRMELVNERGWKNDFIDIYLTPTKINYSYSPTSGKFMNKLYCLLTVTKIETHLNKIGINFKGEIGDKLSTYA